MDEQPLPGFGVVRVGSTVRKPAGPWTPTIHALLTHIRSNGFELAPAPLGADETGREMLEWLDGEPVSQPWPPVLRREEGVIELGRALRRFHDAVRTFDPGPDAHWRAGALALAPGEIVCHGDFAPWNSLWRSDTVVGIVDWDMAEPGPPVKDLAFLALHLVPLRSDAQARDAGFDREPPRTERLELLCTSYGDIDRRAVIEALFEHHAQDRERTTAWGADGREPWVRFLDDGMLDVIDEDEMWLKEHAVGLLA